MEVAVRGLSVATKSSGASSSKPVKTVVDGVSFHVAPMEIVALMGPSGAGKTTVLNQMVGQTTKGLVAAGSISYDKHETSMADFGSKSAPVGGISSIAAVRGSIQTGSSLGSAGGARCQVGYVTQDDIMYESLTPRENLVFAARFLQASTTQEKRLDMVDRVMEKLHLTSCADTLVGTPGLVKGISGGERKRTNVAMSLLGNPSLLLLDEPTSGLDAKMAFDLMSDMSAVAAQGCTIIATIHQPSEAVFRFFTKVLLLSAGRVAYFGPVAGLADKLTTIGFRIPERTPLPEVLLDILERPKGANDIELHEKRLTTLFEKSEQVPLTSQELSAATPASMAVEAPSPEEEQRPRGVEAVGNCNAAARENSRLGFCGQFLVLTQRNMVHTRRTKMLSVVRMAQTVASSVLIGWIFAQLDRDITGVRSRFFAAFMLALSQLLFATLGVVNTFPAERAVFIRETQERWYNPVSYYLSKVFLDTLSQCFFPIFTVLIGYFLIGLNSSSAERVVVFYLILCILCNFGSAMGFAVSASCESVNTALSIVPGTIMPQFMLAGLFIPIQALPQPFRFLSSFSVARYALQALIFNEFNCEVDEACDFAARPSGVQCEEGGIGATCNFCCSAEDVLTTGGVCPVVTCEDAMRFLKVELEEAWPSGDTLGQAILGSMLMMLALTVLFRLIGLVALLVAYRRATS